MNIIFLSQKTLYAFSYYISFGLSTYIQLYVLLVDCEYQVSYIYFHLQLDVALVSNTRCKSLLFIVTVKVTLSYISTEPKLIFLSDFLMFVSFYYLSERFISLVARSSLSSEFRGGQLVDFEFDPIFSSIRTDTLLDFLMVFS